MLVYTIGHSTRSIDEFIKLLQSYEVELLVDVRTVPRSRHVPQFNSDLLNDSLKDQGIAYRHLKALGGLRKPSKDSPNSGWRNASFRGYADYMQTPEFRKALAELLEVGKAKRAAFMCAEAVPWRCHRSLIADALVLLHGIEVRHILSATKLQEHEITPFARFENGRLTYPEPSASGTLI